MDHMQEDIKALVELAIEFKKTYGKDISISTMKNIGCGYTSPEIENFVTVKINEQFKEDIRL